EVRALGRVRAGQRAPRDAVAVHVLVAAEVAAGLQLLRRHHLAAVVGLALFPDERLAQALVHADVQVGHHEHRRLQPVGQVARAPFQPAPTTMPMEAISSSACTIAYLFWPVAESTRSLPQ